MRIRRCAVVYVEPRESIDFGLEDLLAGRLQRRSQIDWIALHPLTQAEVALSDDALLALKRFSPTNWTELADAALTIAPDTLAYLLDAGLLVREENGADAAFRELHWRGLSAALHAFSRWEGIDARAVERDLEAHSSGPSWEALGTPPPAVAISPSCGEPVALPDDGAAGLETLLARRVTCRNFGGRALGLHEVGGVLHSVFGARAEEMFAPGLHLLKKGVPSAGGLHPVEAYVLVQRVEGLEPGLYQYDAQRRCLVPMRLMDAATAAEHALRFVAGQEYFAGAPLLVMPCARFVRNFWKYRQHAKAYRAVVLDAGHLSQTLYLAATERHLGAFVTAAINEVDIERAFGFDPMRQSPLAVCGFGHRGDERGEVEFDPLHAVWPRAGET